MSGPSLTKYFLILTVLMMFAVGWYLYPFLPDQIASHWNINGQVDGYLGKFWGVFLLPIISSSFVVLYVLIPVIDPLGENIESFRKQYDLFWSLLLIFFAYVFSLIILWNMRFSFSFVTALAPGFSVLWYGIGVLLENSKKNWFVGIRTPWTLSNTEVWRKTHELGGKLFKVSAGLLLVGLVVQPSQYFGILMMIVVLCSIFPVFYSFYLYKKN